MSREDYELVKQLNELKENQKRNLTNGSNNNELIIDENTVYEIDYDCYECLLKEKKKYLGGL